MVQGRLIAAIVLLGAGGCDRSAGEPAQAITDPAISGALADEIMIDPDLIRQEGRNSALGGGGPARAPVPPAHSGPEAAAAARGDAQRLAGVLQRAPAPAQGAATGSGVTAALAETGSGKDCVAGLEYSATWAARLPAAIPVYPRGAVLEAAGTDRPGCRLRVVNFLTPVTLDDVADFYWTRARSAGYAAQHRIETGDRVLSGKGRGGASFILYARERDGMTEVDLVTSGG